jgi:hypothetical protein
VKVCYTVSDAVKAMVREEICRTVDTWEEGCSETVWEKVKELFARRWKTKKAYVNITAVRAVPDDYKPIRWDR